MRCIACLAFMMTSFSCGSLDALSSTPRSGGWVPNGQVNAIVTTPTAVFIGGEFTCLSPYTGGGVPVDVTAGKPTGTFPEVNGFVYAASPDGSGGWFIGGEFSQVGGAPRNNVCHVLANGTVDQEWAPSADGFVRALAVSGGKVYAGGEFTNIGGQGRSYIAALDAVTGVADGWDPNADSFINALCVSGSTVYAGGEFSFIGDEARGFIAALDGLTGEATAWDPGANMIVCSLALVEGTVFAGGYFTSIGGASRDGIAALNTAGGAATEWNPGANSCVNALVVSHGMVFAGGSFNSIGGRPRGRLAALDVTTGSVAEWNPGANSPVYALAVSGDTLYVGGSFSTVGGQERNCAAAVDINSGTVAVWNPTASWDVRALAVSGSTIYLGGSFNGIGGVVRRNLAALNAATGIPTGWNPDANAFVYSLAVSGDSVFAGGIFSEIGGQPRGSLAALDISTGAPTEWAGGANDEVRALCAHEGVLYVGGGFSQIADVERNCIAALDMATGAVTSWNPNAGGIVYSLAASAGAIYAGGSFYNIGGLSRTCIAALSVGDGTATVFNPDADECVRAIAVSGSIVYAGGNFTSAGGLTRNGIAALDATTGTATSWDPGVEGYVYTLAVAGNSVYAGGDFMAIGGSRRANLAVVDAVTAAAFPWAPNPNDIVKALAVSGGAVSAGGAFTNIGAEQQEYFAQFDSGLPAPGSPGATEIGLNTITWTWLDNSGEESGFKVYADAGTGPPATPRCTTPANTQLWQQQALSPNTQYAFQVSATNGVVDSQKTANYTAWTQIEPVTGLVFPNVADTSISVAAAASFSNLASGSSGLYFSVTPGTSSGWQHHTGPWASTDLQPNTQYSFSGQSRNGAGSATTPAAAAKYTLASVPVAPAAANPTISSVDVAIGSGDGNPSNTEYAVHVEPAVAGKNWVKADGGLGASPLYQSAGAWGSTMVAGLSDGKLYSFAATARNGDRIATALGPAAHATTLADMIPSLTFTLITEPETGNDTIEFRVELDEVTSPEFGFAAVVVNGLSGTVVVDGAFPVYAVTVNLTDPNSDGTVFITVPPDVLHDSDGNACPGGTSETCSVYNWHGFVEEPGSVDAYTEDLVTFSATPSCGASSFAYSWKWDNGAKIVCDVGTNSALLLIENVTSSREGTYWCGVSYDGTIYPTVPATLSVREHVAILPLDCPTVGPGEPCTFSVSATGGYSPLSYMWEKNGTPIPKATGYTYTTPPLAASDSGSIYTVTVTDNNNDLESVSAHVTVTPDVPAAGVAGKLALLAALTAVFCSTHLRDRAQTRQGPTRLP